MLADLEKRRKKLSFKFGELIVRIIYWKPKFIYLGDKFDEKPLIFIVNHCGSNAPTRIERHFPHKFFMWGTYEMTESFKQLRHYLIHTYYHQKKKVPLFFAYIIGTIFAPFARMFYKGMHLIPTYPDGRFVKTISTSLKAINNDYAIVIYPEDSSHGYKDVIEYFYNGFLALAEAAKRKGYDLPIYVSYYQKRKRRFIIDQPVLYSSLLTKYDSDNDKIAEALRKRLNELKDYK